MTRYVAIIDIDDEGPAPDVSDVALGIDRMFPGRGIDSTVYEARFLDALWADLARDGRDTAMGPSVEAEPA